MGNIGARTGRPTGSAGSNRARILAAARREFAAKGYRGATMRSIATEAGFDVALLSHYFGSKDGLFAATMELPAGSERMVAVALSGPTQTQGERLTRGYLGLWEDPETSAQMRALARSALSNEAASARIHDLLTGTLAGPEITELLDGRRAGFTLAMAHLLGVAYTRYLTRIPHVTNLSFDALVSRTAPAVQLHLNTLD